MRKFWLPMMVLCLAFAGSVRGEEKTEDKKETAPATAPSGDVIEASDIEKLKASVGKTVTAQGKVSGTFTARSGRILINFDGADRDFVAMITKENADAVNAGFDGDVGKAIDGKTINVTGEVVLYLDNPQIEVSKPEQIKVLDQ